MVKGVGLRDSLQIKADNKAEKVTKKAKAAAKITKRREETWTKKTRFMGQELVVLSE
ncbi:hypothetical protein J6590_048703 [Homalodisca vitripennis]|nr:hypothetical protein J6590_048703 [Homalodisca vitripennis]